MTVREFLDQARAQLLQADIATARLDSLVLLEDALHVDRAHLLAYPDTIIKDDSLAQLQTQVAQRTAHVPLAYIRGHAAFYGRDFIVNKHVLVPRPETESIITLLKGLSLPGKTLIADIGTGSGCIGITAALEIPESSVDLYDIDPGALAVAQKNITLHKASTVHTYQTDLLTNVDQPYDVILANLPYVPEHYPVNKATTFEPDLALFSGADGLDHYRSFWQQMGIRAQRTQYVLTESLPSQHHALALLARNAGFVLEQTDDFVQLFSI